MTGPIVSAFDCKIVTASKKEYNQRQRCVTIDVVLEINDAQQYADTHAASFLGRF